MIKIIISGPQGSGKSKIAEHIKAALRCSAITYEIIETNVDVKVAAQDRA